MLINAFIWLIIVLFFQSVGVDVGEFGDTSLNQTAHHRSHPHPHLMIEIFKILT